ncbi:MAG: type II toxin-antitoxin system prevent-host-death family antitoxin [Actinomycetota bacterium]
MTEIGIRDLKQNASEIVARAEAGDSLTVTRRGKPVARLVPIRRSRLDELREAGQLVEPTVDPSDLPGPRPRRPGERPATELLDQLRHDERY